MSNASKGHARKAGLPPGSLIHVGERKVEHAAISVMAYDGQHLEEEAVESVAACRQHLKPAAVTWVNLVGLHDTEILQQFGAAFGLHPLVLEDILNTEQRPRMEDYGEYVYIVLKMIYRRENEGTVLAEQVSLVLGPDYVLTFQEVPGDVFNPIRERIRQAKGRIRQAGCDYLTYALLDAIVDQYFIVLEEVGNRLDDLQEEVAATPSPQTVAKIHHLKREMVFLRKSLWPVRELVSALEKVAPPLISAQTLVFLRDVYDHAIQVMDTVETQREILSGTLDIYLSSMSNRMNEIMRLLTVIATIFIPLTFIAGVYGMNFEHMPELKYPWAYPAVWGIMVVVAVAMLAFFRQKGWL